MKCNWYALYISIMTGLSPDKALSKMGVIRGYKVKCNWYALYISIMTGLSPDKALSKMGVIRRKIVRRREIII